MYELLPERCALPCSRAEGARSTQSPCRLAPVPSSGAILAASDILGRWTSWSVISKARGSLLEI